MSASIWAPGGEVLVNSNNRISIEHFIVSVINQSTFTLTNFTYVLGTNSISVYLNGVMQRSGIDYSESSDSTITFLSHTFVAGDVVSIVGQTSVTSGSANPFGTSIQSFIATAGQTTFHITHINYIPNNGSLRVYINGLLQEAGDSYKEVNGNIVFSEGLEVGDEVLASFNSEIGLGQEAAYVSYMPAGAGAVATDVQTKLRDYVSVKDFGAVGDGITNDTTAIRNAVATGKQVYFPVGTYLVTDAITCSTKGQMICGAGREASVIKVTAAFNLSAQGVFVATSGEEGPQWRDLKIAFTQPDTAVRASLVAYPPAIYATWTPRFSVINCKITNAMTGIDMRGNSGGAFFDLLELSAYNVGIEIDGSLDSVRLSKVQYWPFDLTVNQSAIFNDSSNIGLRSGRCDDLHVENCLFINGGKHAYFYTSGTGVGGTTFGSIVNTDFDSFASVVIDGGNINLVGCFFTIGSASYQAIKATGGFVRVSSCEFECNTTLTNAMLELSGSAGLYMAIENSIFRITGDTTVIDARQTTFIATLILIGNQIVAPQNTTPIKPLINIQAGARLTMQGNRVNDKGAGVGKLLVIANDENHIVVGNAFMGWGMSAPALSTAIIHSNQSVYGSDFSGGFLVGNHKIKQLTGTLDASGNLSVAHGVAFGNQKIILAQVFSRGNSGEMKQMVFNYIDGVNLAASGGNANAAYRALIIYTDTIQGW